VTRSWATPEFVAGSSDACKQLGHCVLRRSSKSHAMVPPWMLLIVSDALQFFSGDEQTGLDFGFFVFVSSAIKPTSCERVGYYEVFAK
jgi:hypothetical protein